MEPIRMGSCFQSRFRAGLWPPALSLCVCSVGRERSWGAGLRCASVRDRGSCASPRVRRDRRDFVLLHSPAVPLQLALFEFPQTPPRVESPDRPRGVGRASARGRSGESDAGSLRPHCSQRASCDDVALVCPRDREHAAAPLGVPVPLAAAVR
eukprot:Amastigsp_a177002_39.p3 type:complete len:153 gc:universal Amastigsp_a177002_39:603-145(-)